MGTMNVIPDVRPVIIGNFGPPTLACIRSWGRQGWKVGMISIGAEDAGLKAPSIGRAISEEGT